MCRHIQCHKDEHHIHTCDETDTSLSCLARLAHCAAAVADSDTAVDWRPVPAVCSVRIFSAADWMIAAASVLADSSVVDDQHAVADDHAAADRSLAAADYFVAAGEDAGIVADVFAADQPADFSADWAVADIADERAVADTAAELAVADNSDAETDAEQAAADIAVADEQQPNFLMTSAVAVVADRHHPRSAEVADVVEYRCCYLPPAETLE